MTVIDLADAIAHFEVAHRRARDLEHALLGLFAREIVSRAKHAIGTYEYAWAPLAASTVADRVAKGYSPDEPLLRSGELRDSIAWEYTGERSAIVGSNSDIAVWQELGTQHIPPRPFLEPSVAAAWPTVERVGAATVAALFRPRFGVLSEIERLVETIRDFKEIGRAIWDIMPPDEEDSDDDQ